MFRAILNFIIWVILVFTITTWYLKGLPRDIKPLLEPLGKPTILNPIKSGIVRLVDLEVGISCSAFVVDANYAFTAAHCLNHEGKLPKHQLLAYTDNSDDYVVVNAVAYDSEIDIGLVQGNFLFHKAVPVDVENDLEHPSNMVICGYPRGQKKMACNHFKPDHYDLDQLLGYGQVHGGFSGGALLDSNGTAVGVVSAHDNEFVYVSPLQGVTGIFTGLKK